jgi:titin
VGVWVEGSGTVIGGSGASARNVISGNDQLGMRIGTVDEITTGVVVQGNYIGLNAAGTAAIGNASGIAIEAASNCTIGGTSSSVRNVISGNGGDGLAFLGHTDITGDVTGNLVQGNFIGTNATNTAGIGNAFHGIRMQIDVHGNTIGGATANAGNTIAFNGEAGVSIESFDDIGDCTRNLISRNSIHSNGGLGIDLLNAFTPDGVTPNDTFDNDVGPNMRQNFPSIASADTDGATSITISGTLHSRPNSSFTIELFSSSGCDASGNGEGRTFLGTTTVTTGAVGRGSFTVTLTKRVGVGAVVTATATDSQQNTSEFSACKVTV